MDEVRPITQECGCGCGCGEDATTPDGEWACFWHTIGPGSRVVSRHATEADAEQAVASRDWPAPGDRTSYLCGYEVRQWDGEWWVAPCF